MLAQYIRNGIPTLWLLRRGIGCAVGPAIELRIRYLVVGIVVPNIIGVGAAVGCYLGLPVLRCLYGDVDHRTRVHLIAYDRRACHVGDIRESVRVKTIHQCAVDCQLGEDSRVLCIHLWGERIYYVSLARTIGFDRDDCRLLYATWLYPNGLLWELLGIVDRHAACSKWQCNAVVSLLDVQCLTRFSNAECSQLVRRSRIGRLEMQLIGALIAILRSHNNLGCLTQWA